MKILLIIEVFILLTSSAIAQKTTVEGIVFEDSTEQTLMFAKVYFKGTQIGITTDSTGYFKLSISERQLIEDSIVVSYLGFKSQTIGIKKGISQKISVNLASSLFQNIEEIVVVAGENPVWKYLRRIIENKELNDPSQKDSYSSLEYAKIRFDLNHFTDKVKENIILRPFDYIWENEGVTDDGVRYLPTLITEQVSKHYYQRKPKRKRDIILAERTTGLEGPNLLKFTKDLYITPNVYDNFIEVLGKSFPSPLNDNYKLNYKFYLTDSLSTEFGKVYTIQFRPKHSRELAFTGEMKVDSLTYAITEIDLRFDIKANVNFVRSYYVKQIYKKLENQWMLERSEVLGDFTVVENASDFTGFFGRKKSSFKNYTINSSLDSDVFKGVERVKYLDSAAIQSEEFWAEYRSVELEQEEKNLYDVTSKVQSDPAFKFRKNLIQTLATGYIGTGGLQVSNLYSFYSYNDIESSRLKIGVRTNPKNEFPWHGSGYLAYGLRDEQFKYELKSHLNLTKRGITRIGGSYKYDIEQIGRSFNQVERDHVLSSFVQIGDNSSNNYVTKIEGYFEKSIINGVLFRIGYFNSSVKPIFGSFTQLNSDMGITTSNDYNWSGLRAIFKFSYLFGDITGTFYDKKDLYKEKRKYPDVALLYEVADNNMFNSDFNYQKVKLSIRQDVNARKLGHFKYNVETGKTFGGVPHVVLDIPFGNQLILADEYAFNLMQYMEFASDQYVGLHLAHHFDGLLLDRIPLINRLKWRSLVFGKSFFGSLTNAKSRQEYGFVSDLTPLEKPYYEFGFGIENIFKFARIDFIWRPTSGLGDYYKFLIKPSFKFSF